MIKLIAFFVLALLLITDLLIYSIKRKKALLVPFFILVIFLCYSLLTTSGAIRMEVASKGHPVIAYTTKVEEIKSMRTDDARIYSTEKEVKNTSNLIKCQKVAFMKYCNYYEAK